jgi:hypothetical protein
MIGAPNISSSGANQPHTMLSAKRPPVTWSIVVACFAATMGWMVGTCEVEKTAMRSVTAPSAAAQV